MVVQIVVAKNLVIMLDLGQPRMVLGEGLKDIHGQLYQGDFLRVYSHTICSWMKFMNLKMHFQSLWTYVMQITSLWT